MASEAASAWSGNDAPGRHPLHPRGCGCSRGHRAPCRPASDSAFYLEDLSPLQVRGQRHLQSPGCPAGLSPRTCCGECGGSPRSPLPLGIPCIPQGPPTSLDTPGQCVWWVGAGDIPGHTWTVCMVGGGRCTERGRHPPPAPGTFTGTTVRGHSEFSLPGPGCSVLPREPDRTPRVEGVCAPWAAPQPDPCRAQELAVATLRARGEGQAPHCLCPTPIFSGQLSEEGQTRGPWRTSWAVQAPAWQQPARPGTRSFPSVQSLSSSSPPPGTALPASLQCWVNGCASEVCSHLCSKAIKLHPSPAQVKSRFFPSF